MKLNVKALAAATALTSAALVANPANAAVFTTTIDVSGIDSFGEFGDPGNALLDAFLAPDALITGLGWDVELEAISPSWLSELTVGFLQSPVELQLAPAAGDDMSGSGFYTSGIIDLGGLDPTFPFSLASDGILSLEFFEAFDDSSISPDGHWVSGSLTIQYEADDSTPTPAVPEPASWAMMMGGLGLMGAFMRRGHRKMQVSFA